MKKKTKKNRKSTKKVVKNPQREWLIQLIAHSEAQISGKYPGMDEIFRQQADRLKTELEALQ